MINSRIIRHLIQATRCRCRHNQLTRTIVSLVLFAGCRPSELSLLRWEDVDFKRRRIRLTGPKPATRSVVLNPELAETLSEWREHLQVAAAKRGRELSPFVLGGHDGTPITPQLVHAVLAVQARALGLPASSHALRLAASAARMHLRREQQAATFSLWARWAV